MQKEELQGFRDVSRGVVFKIIIFMPLTIVRILMFTFSELFQLLAVHTQELFELDLNAEHA